MINFHPINFLKVFSVKLIMQEFFSKNHFFYKSNFASEIIITKLISTNNH